MLDFGKRLKYLREQKGLTQSQLAERLSVSRTMMNWYETGRRYPSLDMLIKLANSFHVSTDYLFGINKEKKLNIDGLSENQINIIYNLISEFKK